MENSEINFTLVGSNSTKITVLVKNQYNHLINI